jgi:hypothetical protein
MRIVIDKDVSEVQLLQEAYEKSRPTYKVRAVNNDDKFIYAKDLKRINEACEVVYDIAFDSAFDDCESEIVELSNGKERVIWSSDAKVVVSESVLAGEEGEKKGFWAGLGEKLGKTMNFIGTFTKNFSKDMLAKWRNAGYFTKDGQITGLGLKVMNGEVENTVPVETEDKTTDISRVWDVAKSNVNNSLKGQGFTAKGEVQAIVKRDKDPITLYVDVVD